MLLIDLLKVLRLNQGVDAVDVMTIEKAEALAAIVVLILEEGDFVAGLTPVEIIQETLIQLVRNHAEERVVKHDGVESAPPQALRETQRRVDIPHRELGVAPERLDVLHDG